MIWERPEPLHVRGSRARCSPDVSNYSKNLPGCRCLYIASVRRPYWLNQQQMDFFCGNWSVLNPLWDDKEFTRLKVNSAISELHSQTTL